MKPLLAAILLPLQLKHFLMGKVPIIGHQQIMAVPLLGLL
jgi:hypothetical protein